MKKNQFQDRARTFIGILLCVVASSTVALGQDEFTDTPDGGDAIYTTDVTVNRVSELEGGALDLGTATVSSNEVNANYYNAIQRETATIPAWSPESGEIVACTGVESNGVRLLKVLVQTRDSIIVYVLDYRLATTSTGPFVTKYPFPLTLLGGYGEILVRIAGDATYVLSTSYLYVYRDSVSSWQVD